MAGIFKAFRGDEISLTPYDAHKDYLVYIENYTGSYYEPYYEQSRIFNHPLTSSDDLVERTVSMSVFAYDAVHEGSDFFPDEIGMYGKITSASGHTKTTNGYFQKIMHSSLQGMFYTNPDDPCWTLDNSGYEKEYRELNYRASVLSVPQRMHGEAIRKSSVKIQSGSLPDRITLKDDGFGNIYDNAITGSVESGSIATSQSINYTTHDVNGKAISLLALNFSGLYNKIGESVTVHSNNDKSLWKQKYGGQTFKIENDTRFFERSTYANKVAMYNGIVRRTTEEGAYIEFDGIEKNTKELRTEPLSSSFMEVEHIPTLDLRRNEDYAIAMRISCSAEQPTYDDGLYDYNHLYIIHKQNYKGSGGGQYPFSLRQVSDHAPATDTGFGTRGFLQAQMRVGPHFVKLNSTGSVTGSGDKWWDVVIAKNDSSMSLYIDGELQEEAFVPEGPIHNSAPITFACTRQWSGYYTPQNSSVPGATLQEPQFESRAHWKGGVSNFHIFNRALTEPEISFHHATEGRMTNLVGNVFYNTGLLALTSENARYSQSWGPMFSQCTLSFENTHGIMEHQYTCNIKEREYMYTMNPTIVDDTKLGTIKHYVTQSTWSPYVTTIGLYDEHLRLLAVGKCSRAIKKSQDYDTTFVVRFDT
jgi:hypothetical protein